MCGRYYTAGEKQAIAEYFRTAPADFPMAPDYNIAPTTFQPIIRNTRDNDAREIVAARWGLIPRFASDLAQFKGITTINARAETVATARTYRDPFMSRRCLVYAQGFYEWKLLPDGTKASPKAPKQPYVIHLRSGEPMAFAGLWDAWKDKSTGEWLQSFTIITVEANELMSTIHTRMPGILDRKDFPVWLDRDFGSQPGEVDQLRTLLRPFDSDRMTAEPCNPAVGNVKNNGPEMLTCPMPPEPGLPLNSA